MADSTLAAALVITAGPITHELSRPVCNPDGPRLFEFHDQAWFPQPIRDGVTDALQFILNLGGVYRSVAPRLREAIQACGAERVVDLCSGAGGPWRWLYRSVSAANGRAVRVCLTDKYPNISAFSSAKENAREQITFYPQAVDAAQPPAELLGFRTLFTSFHHFAPNEAVAILQDAVDSSQGIGIFEAPNRHPLTILATVLMLLGGFATAPFIHPFSISRLFWTYVLPVIPLVLLFDGVVSCLRAYSRKELAELLERVNSENYVWQIGEQPGGIAPITFLIGFPATPRSNASPSLR